MEVDQVSKDEERVSEWETGLPSGSDLTPLSHHLISPELASAFSITAEPFQTMLDVNRASQNTLSSLRRFSSNNFKALSSFMEDRCLDPDPVVVDEEEEPELGEKRKIQSVGNVQEADSELRMENLNDDCSAKTLKRQRLVWTPQLHKRFVEVVAHLGNDSAVPKTIIQLMNVEGLTRENVASHLQKYRLYLKRAGEGGSSNDQLVASTPDTSRNQNTPLPPVQLGASLQQLPIVGVSHGHGHGNMGMSVGNSASGSYSGFEFHPFGMFREDPGHWPANNFGSVVRRSHVTPNNK